MIALKRIENPEKNLKYIIKELENHTNLNDPKTRVGIHEKRKFTRLFEKFLP